MRNRNCDNSLEQVLSKRIYKLLKTWSTDNFRLWPERSIPIPVLFISRRAMQGMVDMVMAGISIN